MDKMKDGLSQATFGAGCFWCVEAIFKRLEGVMHLEPGYTGGHIKNPAYREVCTGRTGHAEVIRVHFDSEMVSYSDLLEVFFATHDPTTLNRQGNDVGTQYRSEIFAHDESQFGLAQLAIEAAEASGDWSDPIVTQLSILGDYYPAEDYHKDYFDENPNQGYCRMVIQPKVKKFEKLFRDKLKA